MSQAWQEELHRINYGRHRNCTPDRHLSTAARRVRWAARMHTIEHTILEGRIENGWLLGYNRQPTELIATIAT